MNAKKILNNEIALLSKRLRKENQFRNRMIILSIILTSLLFTTLFTVAFSMSEMLSKQALKEIETIAESAYGNVTREQYEKLQACDAFLDVSYDIYVGNGRNKEFKTDTVEIRYIEEKAAQWNFCNLKEGHFPEKENEIVVDDILLSHFEQKYAVGDEISLQIDTGTKVYQEKFIICGLYEGNKVLGVSQAYVSQEFLINKIYGSKEKAGQEERLEVFCRVASQNAAEEYFRQVWSECGFEEEASISINWAYKNAKLDMAAIALIGAVSLLIVAAGYLMIYNIFYISIVNDVQFYAQLKLIGMENKQIKSLLVKQTVRLYGIGMPIGLVLGWGVGNLILPMVINMANGDVGAVSTLHPMIFIVTILFTAFTVWLSMRKPMKILEKISPISAFNYTDAKLSKKFRAATKKKFTISLFAIRNLKRTKKKTVLVMLSVILMFVLFSVSANLITSINFEQFLKNGIPNDIYVSSKSFLTNAELENINQVVCEELRNMDGVSNVSPYYYKSSLQLLSEEEKQQVSKLYEAGIFADDIAESMEEILNAAVPIIGENRYYYDDTAIAKFNVLEGELDLEKFHSGDYVILITQEDNVDSLQLQHPGEKITLTDWTEQTTVTKQEDGTIVYHHLDSKEYTVLAVVETYYSMSIRFSNGLALNTILPISEIEDDKDVTLYGIGVDTDSGTDVEKQVVHYIEHCSEDLGYQSSAGVKQEFENLHFTFMVICIGLTVMLGLMAGVNFFNNCMNSAIVRKKEFYTLRSIGMTEKQLLQMLTKENMFLIAISSVIGLIVGTLFSWLGLEKLSGTLAWISYKCNLLPGVIFLLVLLLMVKIFTNVIVKKLKIGSLK